MVLACDAKAMLGEVLDDDDDEDSNAGLEYVHEVSRMRSAVI